MIINKLYQNIIEKEFKQIDSIDILSGYASGSFLKRVVTIYPELKIELYLGMTKEGISKTSHHMFKNLTKLYPHVNVYYQIQGNPNHMKIYSLYHNKGLIKSFVGSANFTENGFEYNKEVLIENKFSFNEIFEDQRRASLICTNKNIEKYVSIHNTRFEEYPVREIQENDEKISDKAAYKAENDRLISIKSRADYRYIKEFEVEIIKDNERNWASTGINSTLYGQTSHIPIGTNNFHNKVFPRDTDLLLETDKGKLYKAFASSRHRDALFFPDLDIYNYMREKIGLKGRRPISRFDLDQVNSSHIKFIRLNEFKYYIEFY